jgi:2'-5' RNA ligase
VAYAIVIYPDLDDNTKIQSFRKKYDPNFHLIKPHLTIVFPFSDIDRKKLKEHISNIINQFGKFNLRLNGFKKSFDNWLFLLAKEGNYEIIKLHDLFYTGILNEYLKKDIEFIPHIGLGLFKNDDNYKTAEKEAEKLNLNYQCMVKSIHLIHLNDDFSKIDWSEEFFLNRYN